MMCTKTVQLSEVGGYTIHCGIRPGMSHINTPHALETKQTEIRRNKGKFAAKDRADGTGFINVGKPGHLWRIF